MEIERLTERDRLLTAEVRRTGPLARDLLAARAEIDRLRTTVGGACLAKPSGVFRPPAHRRFLPASAARGGPPPWGC
jgi:hypothetical protein